MTKDRILAFGTIPHRAFVAPRGQKPIWLPNFTLTLLRTPHLPPTWAQFLVPLNMNKLDIKDYLWNTYGVPVLSVRSFIQQQPMQLKGKGSRALQRRWHRPRSIKKMTVELGTREEGRGGKGGGIFVWPDPPNDQEVEDAFEAWDKKVFDKSRREQRQKSKLSDPLVSNRSESPGRDTVASQAKRILDGEDRWQPTWQDIKKEQ